MTRYPTGKTGMLALLAHPVDHVKGPAFMNPALEDLGRDWFVAPMHVRPENLRHVVGALMKADNYLGVILTIPHKESMASMCDELLANGRLTGAVNAVRFDRDRLVGDMFDGIGLLDALKGANIGLRDRTVLMIGAGGAARAIAFAFCQEGVANLAIHNRTRERAETLTRDIADALPGVRVATAENDPRGYDILVNCTTLGLHDGDTPPIDVSQIEPGQDIVDIIAVRDTELMQAGIAKGCRVVGGVPMALGQIAGFSEFFDPDRQ
ncbi:MAG: shikimate dehydrogenase family protein [Hyphomicrobiaceae bacterium]